MKLCKSSLTKTASAAALSICLFSGLRAQAVEVPFDDPAWEVSGEEITHETIDGVKAMFVHNGRAMIADADFHDGIIEFDIKTDEARGFSGVYWRMTKGNNGENFYIRPHQSGKEDASQYTPVFFGLTSWQLYFGPQFAAPIHYRFNEWMHIKIVVSGSRADIYVDSEEPVLAVNLKQADAPGGVGISSSFAPAWFANFSYKEVERPELRGTPVPQDPIPTGMITRFSVSDAIDETALTGTSLPRGLTNGLSWKVLGAEDRGYANLGRVQALGKGKNTALVRLNLAATEALTKLIRFGYSDRVKVYLNGVLLYGGDNGYMSRDYRYLGTIGLFDEVALPLNVGNNELIFAVSESFGGWGIMALMENQDGVTISP